MWHYLPMRRLQSFSRTVRIQEYSKNGQIYYSWQSHKLLLIKLNSQSVWRIVNYPRRGESKRISLGGNCLRFLVGEYLNQDNSFCCEPGWLSGSRLWQGNRLWPSIRLPDDNAVGRKWKVEKALVQKSIAHFLLFCIGILMFAEIKADKT